MINTVEICKNVLDRLSKMDYEKGGGSSFEQLIFPNKIQAKGDVKRISEQELRLLFIEEYKKAKPELFYSIETPTFDKFSLGKSYETIKSDGEGRSASLDMCVFDRISGIYNRIYNIEFKHKCSLKNVGKDVFKLMKEAQNGAFIQIFDNTNSGTFSKNGNGIFHTFYRSFIDFWSNWRDNEKSIQIIILSLTQKTIIHREIKKQDFNNLKDIFYIDKSCGNINEIKDFGWKNYILK